MASVTPYLIFWIVMFAVLGAFWYAVDRRYGQKTYRTWYRLTHERPLPKSVERGFVFNRNARHKALMASLLSTAQSIIAVISIDRPNLFVELILWIVEVPMTMLGFALGPWIYRLWQRKDELFDALDDYERKTQRPTKRARRKSPARKSPRKTSRASASRRQRKDSPDDH